MLKKIRNIFTSDCKKWCEMPSHVRVWRRAGGVWLSVRLSSALNCSEVVEPELELQLNYIIFMDSAKQKKGYGYITHFKAV